MATKDKAAPQAEQDKKPPASPSKESQTRTEPEAKAYVVISPLRHGGKNYAVGAELVLSDEQSALIPAANISLKPQSTTQE